jgi:hypothetical protein
MTVNNAKTAKMTVQYLRMAESPFRVAEIIILLQRRFGTTLRGLIKSLTLGAFNSLRQNKLAAVLAGISCLAFTYLSVAIQYDERPRYRETILPQVTQAESEFLKSLEAAERASSDEWRFQYFLSAHYHAKEVLRIANEEQPTSSDGIRAHSELIRYYQLMNENMAIIRTEMSIKQDLDYFAEWKRVLAKLEPIRQNWLRWVAENSGT